LADFNDAHYGADFRGDDNGDWSKEERRKAYTAKRAARVDGYGLADVGGLLEPIPEHRVDTPDPGTDQSPTPEYLNDPEYKRARDEYRKHLSPGRKHQEPKPSKQLDRAKWVLEKAKKQSGKDKKRNG
jgi:hypothetical protein